MKTGMPPQIPDPEMLKQLPSEQLVNIIRQQQRVIEQQQAIQQLRQEVNRQIVEVRQIILPLPEELFILNLLEVKFLFDIVQGKFACLDDLRHDSPMFALCSSSIKALSTFAITLHTEML
jgi:hypothetical protein